MKEIFVAAAAAVVGTVLFAAYKDIPKNSIRRNKMIGSNVHLLCNTYNETFARQ